MFLSTLLLTCCVTTILLSFVEGYNSLSLHKNRWYPKILFRKIPFLYTYKLFYSETYLYSLRWLTNIIPAVKKRSDILHIDKIGNVIMLMYFLKVFLIVFTHYICIRNAYLIITFPLNETIFNGHKLMLWSLMNYVHENTFKKK